MQAKIPSSVVAATDGAKIPIVQFPQWFAAIFALIYISGYLIDFFYYGFLGITDPGSEPLKLHYIQIGLVFLLGYIITVSLLVFSVFGYNRMYKAMWREHRPASNILLSIMTIIFSLTIYIATIFTPPQYFRNNSEHLNAILEFIVLITIGYVIMAILTDALYNYIENLINISKYTAGEKRLKLKRLHLIVEIFRSLTIGIITIRMIYLDYVIFRELFVDLKEMIINAGWTYLAFSVIFSVLFFRLIKRLGITQPGFAYAGVVFLGSGILIMIYFLSIVSYAYTIFPYIASAKGGAGYTSAPHASIMLRPHLGETDARLFASDVIVLYTTSSAIYVANYNGENNPCRWRARSTAPVIVGVMRREIQSITSSEAPRGNIHPNCNVP